MYGKADIVKNYVREFIDRSNSGDQILPEIKLAKKLNVSHSTVRRAVDELVEEGLLVRRHGSGTYVHKADSPRMKQEKAVIPLADFFQTQKKASNTDSPMELSFATYESADEIALYHNLISKFEVMNPEFRFKLNSYPDTIFPEYFHEIEEGNPPDLFYLNQSHMFWMIRNRYVLPMNDYAGNNFDNLDSFMKKAITYKEKIWIMPKNLHVFYLVYNKRLFREAGIEYPSSTWSWKEYLDAAKALTRIDKTDEQKSVYGAVPHRDYLYLTPLVWSFGGELVDNNGVVKLDTSETVEAIHFAVDLTMKHRVTTQPEQWHYWQTPHIGHQVNYPFRSGKLAMEMKSATSINNYLLDDLDFGIAPIPMGPCGRFSPLMYSGWAVASSSKNPEICGKLLTHLGIDSVGTFSKKNLSPFVTQETLQSYFTPSKPANAYSILVMKNHLREFSFQGHYWPYLMGYIDRMFRNIFHQKCSIKSAIEEAQKEMQSAMGDFLRWYEE